MRKIKKIFPFFIPPIVVAAIVLWVFKLGGLYPFGKGSVSWCDMNQQTVPLLIQFKDILDGKGSLFLNMYDAGGMNFYGVFFFFLASPFSFLVKFVDKADMILFANILVMLKLMTASVTSMAFLRGCKKGLDWQASCVLSVMYAFCGYGMLYYQNIIWLDMMYLFPLLLWALHKLVEKQKNLPYIIIVSLMLVVNYYIGYMIVLFILLFMCVHIMRNAKDEKAPLVCTKFISGSLIGALLTAVVWLPCLTQYLSSGRGGKTIKETLIDSNFIVPYKTMIPMFFCTAFITVVLIYNVVSGQKRTKETNTSLLVFALMLVPCIIEPINIMWHTGNYMSFPGRYGFIVIFMGLSCCADFMSADKTQLPEATLKKSIVGFISGAIVVFAYFKFTDKIFEEEFEKLIKYTGSLWADDGSFEGLLKLFLISLICYGFLYYIYKNGKLLRSLFLILVCMIMAAESMGNLKVYMTSYYTEHNPDRTADYMNTLEIADKIDDDSFYRVATNSKIMDYNLVGALGYPSLSHYTSLTNQDFMFTQKRLGYTSVWMEVGSSGGTELTNALYSIKYKLTNGSDNNSDTVYKGKTKSIVKNPYSIGLGLVTDADLSQYSEIPENMPRGDIQKLLATTLFKDENLITKYDYLESSLNITYENGEYSFLNNNSIARYTIDVKGKQSLYFDCFNTLSNNLSEEYYKSFSITVNDRIVENEYPNGTNNGFYDLGEFENETVVISVKSKKDISCYSFGIIGLDLELMEQASDNAKSVNFIEKAGKITGSVNAQKGEKCLLAVPYNEGFTVKINGEKVEYSRAFSDFIAFDLKEGNNDIKITFAPQGFYPALAISFVGAGILVAYLLLGKKIKLPEKLSDLAQSAVMFFTLVIIAGLYVLPIVISIMGEKT